MVNETYVGFLDHRVFTSGPFLLPRSQNSRSDSHCLKLSQNDLSYDDCLEVEGSYSEVFRAATCCVVYNSCRQWYAHIWAFLKFACSLGLDFIVYMFIWPRFNILWIFLAWTLFLCWVRCVGFSFFKRLAGKNVSEMTYFGLSGM